MRKITMIRTIDGAMHENTKEASRHLDKEFGIIISRHAHRLAQIDKYTDICDYLEENLAEFKKALNLKNDLKLTEDED